MKFKITTLLFLFFLISGKAFSHDRFDNGMDSVSIVTDDVVNNVVAALSAGDANRLASYFNSTIDLTVPSGDGSYSKSQAEMMVKNFFTQNTPVSFRVNQQGSSNEGSLFCIGTLTTKTATYRTYFLVKKVNGVSLVHQLQFEKE
jgi:hypothetical protein